LRFALGFALDAKSLINIGLARYMRSLPNKRLRVPTMRLCAIFGS
jgi:hypothetical protein